MYPWIRCELVADPLGSAQYTLGTTGLGCFRVTSRWSTEHECHVSLKSFLALTNEYDLWIWRKKNPERVIRLDECNINSDTGHQFPDGFHLMPLELKSAVHTDSKDSDSSRVVEREVNLKGSGPFFNSYSVGQEIWSSYDTQKISPYSKRHNSWLCLQCTKSTSLKDKVTVQGSNSGGGWNFPHPSIPEPGAHPASCTKGTVSLTWG